MKTLILYHFYSIIVCNDPLLGRILVCRKKKQIRKRDIFGKSFPDMWKKHTFWQLSNANILLVIRF